MSHKERFYQTEHKEQRATRYVQNVCFDADSTLSLIEGIDELAKMNGTAHEIVQLTQLAMNGVIRFEDVYFERLNRIQPSYKEVKKIGHMYRRFLTPGATETIQQLHAWGTRTFIISGGFNPAIRMLAHAVGIPQSHVFANEFTFNRRGKFTGVNMNIPFPLWSHEGKKQAVQYIQTLFPGQSTAMVGDGIGDLEAGELTDQFVCFAGIAPRPTVLTRAQHVVRTNNLTAILPYLEC